MCKTVNKKSVKTVMFTVLSKWNIKLALSPIKNMQKMPPKLHDWMTHCDYGLRPVLSYYACMLLKTTH